MVKDVRKVTWKLNTITHADDTSVLVKSKDNMTELIAWVKNGSKIVGLNLNLKKSTVMSTVEKVNIFTEGEDISTVNNYKFLVVLITNDSYTNEENKKRISLSKPEKANLTKVIKGFEISASTKVKRL